MKALTDLIQGGKHVIVLVYRPEHVAAARCHLERLFAPQNGWHQRVHVLYDDGRYNGVKSGDTGERHKTTWHAVRWYPLRHEPTGRQPIWVAD